MIEKEVETAFDTPLFPMENKKLSKDIR